jgi:hypothetical protein
VVMGNLVVYGWEYRGSRVWAIERDGLGQMASPVGSWPVVLLGWRFYCREAEPTSRRCSGCGCLWLGRCRSVSGAILLQRGCANDKEENAVAWGLGWSETIELDAFACGRWGSVWVIESVELC